MIFIFIRYRSMPLIKLWVFIAIVISYLGISFIAPEKWLGYGKYSTSETEVLSLRTIIIGGFRWIIVIIAYIKYYKLSKQCE